MTATGNLPTQREHSAGDHKGSDRTATERIQVEVVETNERFCQLEDEWQKLTELIPNMSLFLTWEYVAGKWKHFADDRQLWVLVARDVEGNLVGLLPLAIAHRSIGPFRLRRLEFVTRSEYAGYFYPYDGENLDILSHPDYQNEVAEAFLDALRRQRRHWDVADLALLSSGSPLRRYKELSGGLSVERMEHGYITTLPDTWKEYVHNVVGTGRARKLRYRARLFERDFPDEVEYHLISESDAVGPAVDNLIEMNRRRWEGAGQSTVFEDERFVRFHREFIETAFERGWLRFYQLRVAGQVVAATCRVDLGGTHYSFQKGFEPDWSKYGPGAVLQAYELASAIEDGQRICDWGIGAPEAKAAWIDSTREYFQIVVSTSWRGAFYIRRDIWWASTKRLVRRLLPESVYLGLRRRVLRIRRKVLGGE